MDKLGDFIIWLESFAQEKLCTPTSILYQKAIDNISNKEII